MQTLFFPPGERIPFPFIFSTKRLFLKNNNKKFIFSLRIPTLLFNGMSWTKHSVNICFKRKLQWGCLLVIGLRKDTSTVEYWHPEIPQYFVNRQQKPDLPKLIQIFSDGKRNNAMDMQTVEGPFNHWHDIISLTHEWLFLN